MLKSSLHIHIKGDPRDYIEYSGFELIRKAHDLGFEVLAITCHWRVVMWDKLQKYAKKRGILLISGVELCLQNSDVIVLNAPPDIEFIQTLSELKTYKKKHPEIFVIAPHPFFPSPIGCLKKLLYKHLDLFDGIEESWFHSKTINFNKKAAKLAQQNNIPYIATGDVHLLEQLDLGHVLINAQKNTESVLEALRKNRFKSISHPVSVFKMIHIFGKMNLNYLKRFFPWSPPHIPFLHEKFHQNYKIKSQAKSKNYSPTRSRH